MACMTLESEDTGKHAVFPIWPDLLGVFRQEAVHGGAHPGMHQK